MKSEPPSRSRIAVPLHVRWREFRIQLLPFFACASALLLSALVWQTVVKPITIAAPPPLSSGGPLIDPDPPLENSKLEQVSHAETNAIARSPGARD